MIEIERRNEVRIRKYDKKRKKDEEKERAEESK